MSSRRRESESWEKRAGEKVLRSVLDSDPMPITEVRGARAVYLIFYTGSCHLYERISDGTLPIYVGQTADLSRRIQEHVYSLEHARDLRVDNFHVVSESLKTLGGALLGESALTDALAPVWNDARFSGFGSKHQGLTRAEGQAPSPWDRLHPGRRWNTASLSRSLRRELKTHLGSLPSPSHRWPASSHWRPDAA
ncbi:MAG: Eco29kI family restriction endonuclease [Actinomycetota bacterium]